MNQNIERLLQLGNGNFPAHASVGAYPLFYIDGNNDTFCAKCATKSATDPEELEKFKPVACEINWDDDLLRCERCNRKIDSAYCSEAEEQPPTIENPKSINTVTELLVAFTTDTGHENLPEAEALSLLKKYLFKFTDCGAFIEPAKTTTKIEEIAIGSIIGGSDAQTTTHTFAFPFDYSAFSAALDSIEAEAKDLWEEANEETTHEAAEI